VTQVSVAVATLWTDPARVRPVDEPAVGAPADVRSWAGSLSVQERDDLDGRTLSQLLLGERVLVEEVRDGWARVVALDQPASKLDPRGYPGWLPAAQLTDDGAEDRDATHLVAATATALRDAPDGDMVLPGVILGTRLAAVDEAQGGWLPVAVPGRAEPAWALLRDLTDPPTGRPDPAEVLATAASLLDVRYVWGGLSAYGIDCSGLVHLTYRRHGIALPRDADDQAAATTPLEPGEERPGDLYFFARDGRRVHHIGFVASAPAGDGGRELLHACGTHRRVVREPLTGERAATLLAAHRVA
jgi:cell wall-associated NlpC family hydrolase